jgi:hypothetical protein
MNVFDLLEDLLNFLRTNIDVIEIFVIVFVLPYLAFKGKRRFEQIRKQNYEILEQGKKRHQLHIAALDRRLQAHQEAYALWWHLVWSVDKEENVDELSKQCQKWWVKNCLYLDAESRRAFFDAFYSASLLSQANNSERHKSLQGQIWDAGRSIVEGVELPPMQADTPEFPLKPLE